MKKLWKKIQKWINKIFFEYNDSPEQRTVELNNRLREKRKY